ncbi:FAD-dependent oxidoreductase [Pseudoroseomonas wenyumeiae]|uniref:FAD-dependent oxidoreductase n=1 Tax=Teichococcus wenyumeiae TaxID=2478470 RepID=A0A3A9JLW6_9PROT|nr:NAD(P)/FAD-dependent oxidoreductase [Pseudoroseomonas wenyumeiae]RKK04806.1 NAD(P)/FAD-dependent oxidoreductase [Pseudoroseomonas wenyumeiae]RMI19474.1 FAD-dependent oxidoreductase [Pseudoroseomonas wenyumeiae]
MPDALAALERSLRQQLEYLDYPAHDWVPPAGDGVLDVAIIGGGQTGLTTAFALRRQKVGNTAIFDRAPPGGTGVWTTFARMRTLRTPKHVTGPDLGIPALTPRAFFEARDGAAAWQSLHKIGREDWQRYLDWYVRVLDLPVQHEHALTQVEPEGALLRLRFATPGGEMVLRARRLVLATGMDGCGAWVTPAPFDRLPPEKVLHTAQEIDFAGLAGKRLLVVGAGASAFDNLATALEAGAAEARMLVRRPRMPRVNPFRWMEQAGFLGQHHALPDLLKWRFIRHIFELNQPPPQESWDRVASDPRFSITMGAPVTAARMVGQEVELDTPRGSFRADAVILGTGSTFDLDLRPELALFAQHIRLWRDAFTPPPGEESALCAVSPYLSDDFSFQEKQPGTAPFLTRIHCITYAATLSMGLSGASISGMKYGVPRLADGLCRALWREDAEKHLAALQAYDLRELTSLIPEELAEEAAQ